MWEVFKDWLLQSGRDDRPGGAIGSTGTLSAPKERVALSPLNNIILGDEDWKASSTSLDSLISVKSGAGHVSFESEAALYSTEEELKARLARLPDAAFPLSRLVLPKSRKKGAHAIDLILDLDETLVHSTMDSAGGWDFMIEVKVDGFDCLYYVHKRPNLDYFIDVEYADPVVSWLDQGRRLFPRRYFRQHCTEKNGLFMKNLGAASSDLSRVCLLDNSLAAFLINPDNAIPISSWLLDDKDTALIDLLPFLDALRFVHDVRSVLSLRRMK